MACGSKLAVHMIGAFPPPVHGMALVNASMREYFRAAGMEPRVIDIAAKGLNRSLFARLGRLPIALRGLLRFIAADVSAGEPLYLSVSGGLGQVYELFFALLARRRAMPIYVHHHSFAYLDRPRWITGLLVSALGVQTVHIVLSELMGIRLQAAYSGIARVVQVSNAALVQEGGDRPRLPRGRLRTLGFIGNIAEDKGIYEFLDLLKACHAGNLELQATVAGPFLDRATRRRVLGILASVPNVRYAGPLYGDSKRAFFDALDLLVFPTGYADEAEPLTIHEALRHGVPVIAFGRGSIPDLLQFDAGLVIDPRADFVPAAVAQVRAWVCSPDAFRDASVRASERYDQVLAESTESLRGLAQELLGLRQAASA